MGIYGDFHSLRPLASFQPVYGIFLVFVAVFSDSWYHNGKFTWRRFLLNIGNVTFPGMVALAPMAGVTDWAFRSICAKMGAGVTVTEMVSSRALIYKDKKTAALLRKNEGSVVGAQIFGNDPETMAEGARLALGISNCDFIDINMGCPMGKIVNNGDGSALMKNQDLAARIVEAVAQAVPVPVTVKCRLGWDKGNINVVPFAKALEQAGAQAITVHGRTRSMLYSGVADWDTIRKVKEEVRIPVIANGDIFSGEAAVQCLKRSGADYLMIGRGCFGDPWLFEEVNAALEGRPYQRPPLSQRMDTALEQFYLAREDKGDHIACLEARKHFAWYLRGVPYSGYFKERISHISTIEQV